MTVKIEGIPIERFNGANIEELYQCSLPDRLDYNLDIVIVNICPTLYSVFIKYHHSGPGNHIWQCLHESGLTDRLYKSTEDASLLSLKIGMVNMLQTAVRKNPSELTPLEIKSAQETLTQRIRQYNPKIIAFNGKLAYEIYAGKNSNQEFNFGKQSMTFDNNTTNTLMFVLPSSEARGASYRLIPKYTDKIPFFLGLKHLRDTLNGTLTGMSENDFIFPEFKVALKRGEGYIGSDGEEEENSLNDSRTPSKVKGRYQKMNNLPYSQIPASVLDVYESTVTSKGMKKDMIIPTSEEIYYTDKGKLSSEQTSDFSNTIMSVVSSVLCDQGSVGTPSVSSGFDEQMNSDSNESSTTSAEPVGQPSLANNQMLFSAPSLQGFKPANIKPLHSKPAVINLSSGNNTIKQILSAPINGSLRNITAQTVNLSQQTYRVGSTGNSSTNVIKIQNILNPSKAHEPSQSQASPQIVRKDMNTIIMLNQASTNKNIKIVPKPTVQQKAPVKILSAEPKKIASTESSQVRVASTQEEKKSEIREPIKVNEANTQNKTLKETLSQPVLEEVNRYEPVENIPYIDYELVIQNKYQSSDYYTFSENKYSNEDNMKILNHIVQLQYSHEGRTAAWGQFKRHFSSMKEADSNILNCGNIKQVCKLDLTKL